MVVADRAGFPRHALLPVFAALLAGQTCASFVYFTNAAHQHCKIPCAEWHRSALLHGWIGRCLVPFSFFLHPQMALRLSSPYASPVFAAAVD